MVTITIRILYPLANSEVVHKPKIMGNPAKFWYVYVNIPGNYRYSIIDLNRQNDQPRAKLINGINNINLTMIVPGVYVIQFNGNNQQWTDKILRQ